MKAYVHYDNISLNSSYNEKYFRKKFVEKFKKKNLKTLFLKTVTFVR